MPINDNLEGHRARLEALLTRRPREEALERYVGGGGDALGRIGLSECELIARHRSLDGVRIVDIGCGVGRMTRFLLRHPIAAYFGTDILDEVLEVARAHVGDDPRFSFQRVEGMVIPAADSSVDIVSAFSVMTHLLDEEVFQYFAETARVLAPGGVAVFSFKDFSHKSMREEFLRFIAGVGKRIDVLKWFEKDTLRWFAEANGLQVVEFIDSGSMIDAQWPDATQLDDKPFGEHFDFAQSLVYLRKP